MCRESNKENDLDKVIRNAIINAKSSIALERETKRHLITLYDLIEDLQKFKL